MALDDDIRLLSGVPLFQSFTPDQLRLLAFGAENMRLAQGQILYEAGARADGAFVVAAGSIGLFREDVEGERILLASIGPGAMLGELALIADAVRPTGAVAVEDTELVRLSRRLFHRILQEYPELAAALHNQIAEGLASMVGKIDALAPRFSD
ncbi:MAG: cyclic nucleotide-binding protein [Rhizobiales bacterium 65-79]|nr:cyclic nucleotide-binding domain-containing protein [Hyphomicrobiales bacterium]OJU04728.1 MAG: cyclic nucleotide-binding protein [Rhizobiales bacterium 65-79]